MFLECFVQIHSTSVALALTSGDEKGLDAFVKHDTTSEASVAIEGVLNKLHAKGLSCEAVVRELIREATDENNLGVIFFGWAPFL
ncbi:unnamed protein product [Ambrosiozyma monospora]|uniref:Unnamed protein product n=1 Tax=Ambrosiozyma monospora TaxID=43982 RepID=A0ACB5SVN9_AMBMO|nr:unnamed protein product [Ambrosiozyma monospora]